MLKPVSPQDLHFEWQRVREGLLVVQETTSDDWLPEDVYGMLMGGAAALFIGEDESGEYLGFLILQLQPMFHGKKLHVMCAYNASTRTLMHLVWPELQELARRHSAKKITFLSNREEWQAVAKRLGCSPAQTQYEYEI
jgi:hypothetical protein